MNLVEKAVSQGGRLAPLIIPHGLTSGTGLMNPSIFIDDDGDILVNLRHVNYSLYTSENDQKFPCPWGPLSYLHPEKDQRLVTTNYLLRLDKDLNIINQTKVDYSKNDVAPLWTFVGEEDCRIARWDGDLYLMGVRRDTTTNGQGRMEYSKIELDKESWTATEVSRVRMPAPGANDTYCEKNWEPILDKPYHFVKWSMPTEIVWSNPDKPETKIVSVHQTPEAPRDQRGGTNVLAWGDYYISFTHEVWLWYNYLKQKDSIYRHRLLIWDKEFNFVGLGESLSFFDVPIEFCVGAAHLGDDLLLSFGVQDNAAFVLQVPGTLFDEMIKEAIDAYVVEYEVDENIYEVPDYAKFYVYKSDLISDVIREGNTWEVELHEVFEKYITKDSVVIEGGCHIGTHTIKLSQLAKEVLCFEPLKSSQEILQKNIKLNNCENVTINFAGLSNEIGKTSFSLVNKDNLGGAVLSTDGEGSADIDLVTIDSLKLKKLDFIKLDVEGYEQKVILGALKTIKKFSPVITLECWDTYPNATIEHATEEFKMLLDLGYKIEQISHHDFLFTKETL